MMILRSAFVAQVRSVRRRAVFWCLCAFASACLPAAAEPVGSLPETLAKGVPPGTVVTLRGDAGPVVADLVAENLHGQPDKPVVIRGVGEQRAVIRGRLRVKGAAYLTLERLAFEPEAAQGADGAWVDIEGDHITLHDCTIRGVSADGLRLVGTDNVVEGGELAACEGYGIRLDGTARVNGTRVVARRRGGLRVGGEALVSTCLLLHNRGPALVSETGAAQRFYHNLVYDNGGGLRLDAARSARVLNNLFVNDYAAAPLSDEDLEIRVRDGAQIDHNIYFRHPAKDMLLRGLPYAQGVDLSPLAADNPFGLRLGVDGAAITSLADPRWAGQFDRHSQSLDVLQRLTGENTYTRSYEDLFQDLQQEDFRPRYTSPAVGRGGEMSGDERHTADRIRRPELHVDHCVFDVGNAFLFDGNDSPTKHIPFANHQIWEHCYFLLASSDSPSRGTSWTCIASRAATGRPWERSRIRCRAHEPIISRRTAATRRTGALVKLPGRRRTTRWPACGRATCWCCCPARIVSRW